MLHKKKIAMILVLSATSSLSLCYSELFRTQRAGVPWKSEEHSIAPGKSALSQPTFRATRAVTQPAHGLGRPGGPERQRWAEIDFVPHLDKAGGRLQAPVTVHGQSATQRGSARFSSRPRAR